MAGAAVTWSSADASVATVDASGLATAVANGTATITAAAGSARGTARITVDAPHHAPPYRGTVFLDPDIIVPSDPTDFVGLKQAGRGDRLVYDRRTAAWITIQAYLFDATFANGLSTEFQVNPEFGTWAEAEAAARAYAPAIGQIPAALREDVDAVWIHRGDEAFGGGNRSLLVHTDRGNQYRQQGFLAEVFVHEGVHTSLDSTHAAAPGWLAAQAADPTFISTYARDHPDREDLAESFSAWLAVRHRSDRITEGMADTITAAIPHRLAYFDSLDLNLCPVAGGEACEARAKWTLSGTQLHEIGHDFAFATWPQAWDTSNWFVEGTAQYFEGGVFTDASVATRSLRTTGAPTRSRACCSITWSATSRAFCMPSSAGSTLARSPPTTS